MLRFQTYPDEIFTTILEESVTLIIDQIKEVKANWPDKADETSAFAWLLPFAHKVFNPETALKTLNALLFCNKMPGVYRLNDYHYLLLYDTLQYFCEVHNDMVRIASTIDEKNRSSKVGAFRIDEIRFDVLISTYFYDIDFLLDTGTMFDIGSENRNYLGIDEETFGISQGLAPHPEELIMKVQEDELPVVTSQSRFWGPSSSVYPDLEAGE